MYKIVAFNKRTGDESVVAEGLSSMKEAKEHINELKRVLIICTNDEDVLDNVYFSIRTQEGYAVV